MCMTAGAVIIRFCGGFSNLCQYEFKQTKPVDFSLYFQIPRLNDIRLAPMQATAVITVVVSVIMWKGQVGSKALLGDGDAQVFGRIDPSVTQT